MCMFIARQPCAIDMSPHLRSSDSHIHGTFAVVLHAFLQLTRVVASFLLFFFKKKDELYVVCTHGAVFAMPPKNIRETELCTKV